MASATIVNRKLTIGVDIRCLAHASTRRRGIGRYLTNLLPRMFEQAAQHQFILFGDDYPWSADTLELCTRSNVRYEMYSGPFAGNLDLFLLTDPLPVLRGSKLLPYPVGNIPCAAIIYDLIPLAFPAQYLSSDAVLQQEYIQKIQCLSEIASCFLPISDFVGQELNQKLRIDSEKIHPIYGGLDETFNQLATPGKIAALKNQFNLNNKYFIYAGGFDYRKNVSGLLEAFVRVHRESSGSCKLVLVGECDAEWLKSQKNIESSDLLKDVQAIGFVPDDDLRALYAGATALVFPSLHEGFGLPALEAMACGCPVIASNGSSLKEIVADAGLLVDPLSSQDIASAMLRVMNDSTLSNHLRDLGYLRVRNYPWDSVATRALAVITSIAASGQKIVAPSRKLRVSVQNRENALMARGGDTVIMENLYQSLRNLDVDVELATPATMKSDADLIHLINLTVREVAVRAAETSARHDKPLLITTLFEDWPRYLDRSLGTMAVFREYMSHRLDERGFQEALSLIRNRPDGPSVGSNDVIEHATALLACGESEAERLRGTYHVPPDKIYTVKFPVKDFSAHTSPKLREYIRTKLNFQDYIVCCGRLESRKNQLMLLKALQDDELPIIFASGGFSPQPEYVKMVQDFKRKGPVRIFGRMPDDALAALLCGASAHVLPSWYELPGLVTLEAATCGIPVVASDWGAIADYLPENSFISCQPDNLDSIRSAVMRAMATHKPDLTAEIARKYTLEQFGESTLQVYEQVLSRKSNKTAQFSTSQIEIINTEVPQEQRMNSETRKQFDVSIIIPVHNQSQLTLECLEAISADNPSVSYEVIIVDNHSTDDTPRILESIEGDIKIIREPSNRGFAAACNRGAKLADGKYLLFLNNDTAPQPGWLDTLVDCAAKNPDAGAIGARLLYPNGKVQHAGVAVNINGIPYHIFQNFDGNHPAATETRDMQAVTAACLLTPAVAFAQAGGFDESYTNGFEDVDFCLKLNQSGRRVIYCGDAIIMHHEGSTSGRKEHDGQNLELFLQRWSSILKCDEEKYLSKFGFKLVWGKGGGTYQPLNDSETQMLETSDFATLVDRARKQYAAGEFDLAARELQNLVQSRMTLAGEDGFELWQTLGNCLARLNRAEEAETAFLEAIKLNSVSERPYLGLGSVAMLQQNWMAAQHSFTTALTKNPSTMRGEFGIGVSLAARNRHDEAITHFERVVAAEPNNAEALFYLYKTAMEIGKPERVIDALVDYVMAHPADVDFMFHLCGALWKAGQLTRAVEVCTQILELYPEHSQARDVMAHMEKSLVEHV